MTGRGLIGSTGFVGGNLARQATFDDGFSSKTIDQIAGRQYRLLVCAGAPAEKWRANKEPDADWASLTRLMTALETVRAERVVLISTVDVYSAPNAVDEATAIDPKGGQPYGRHRLALERFVRERFPATVLRLPGLFGPGIKKNVIFDLLNGKSIDHLAPSGTHQYYDLGRLWADLELALSLGLDLVNLATEPVTIRSIAEVGFGVAVAERPEQSVVHYDMRSRHAEAFGGTGGYLENRETVLARIRRFVESSGWVRP